MNTNNTTGNSSRKKMAANLYRKMKLFTDDLGHDIFRIFIKLQTSLKAERNIRLTPGLLQNKAEGLRNTNNTSRKLEIMCGNRDFTMKNYCFN